MSYNYRTALESQGGKIKQNGNRIEVLTGTEIERLKQRKEKVEFVKEVFFLALFALSLVGLGIIIALY